MKLRQDIKFCFLFLIIFFAAITYRVVAIFPPWLRYDPASIALQASQIIDGYLPVFWPGQAFMSAIGSYLLAFLFKFFGKTVFLLNLAGFILTIVFIISTFFLNYKLFGKKISLLSLFFFMIPTTTMMYWSFQYRPDYQICFILVPWLFLTTYKLYENFILGKKLKLYSFLLGLLAGIGMWNNMAIGPAIFTSLVALFLYLRVKFFKSVLVLFCAGFILGFLPVIYYNITIDCILFKQSQFCHFKDIPEIFYNFLTYAFPFFWGIHFNETSNFIIILSYHMFLFWVLILYVFFVKIVYLKIVKKSQDSFQYFLICFYFFFHLSVTMSCNFGKSFITKLHHPTIYITTLYAVSFTILAIAVNSMKIKKHKILLLLPFMIYQGNNICSTRFYFQRFAKGVNELSQNNKDSFFELPVKTDGLNRFCKKKQLKSGYYAGKQRVFQSLYSIGQLIISSPDKEEFLPYFLKVDKEKNIFWYQEPYLEDLLKMSGIQYFKQKVKGEYIYYNFSKKLLSYKLINSFTITQENQAVNASYLNDRDIYTYFSNIDIPNKQAELLINFSKDEKVSKIIFIPRDFISAPESIQIEALTEDGDYKKMIAQNNVRPLFWSQHHPFMKQIKPRIEMVIPKSIKTSSLKLKMEGGYSNKEVAIREVYLYENQVDETFDQAEHDREIDKITNLIIKKYKKYMVVADHWFSSYFASKQISVEYISNYYISNTGIKNHLLSKLTPVNLSDKTMIISDNSHLKNIQEKLSSNKILYEIINFKYYHLFIISDSYKNNSLYWNGLEFNEIDRHEKKLTDYIENPINCDLDFSNQIKVSSYFINTDKIGVITSSFECSIMKINKFPYYLFVHFLDEQGKILFQSDIELKIFNLDNTAWKDNRYYILEKEVQIPDKVKGRINVQIGIWCPETGKRLKVNNNDSSITLQSLELI